MRIFLNDASFAQTMRTPGVQIVDERYPPQPTSAVGWRAENEAYALEAATENVRIAMIRPAAIVHDPDNAGAVLDAMRRNGAQSPYGT